MRGEAHTPTVESRKLVVDYRRDGMVHEHIAAALKISHDTLKRKYAEELASVTPEDAEDEWRKKFEAKSRQRMLADDCPPVLIIFGLKSKCGWREVVPIDPTKEAPIENLTDEQLRAITAEHAKRARSEGGARTAQPASSAA